MDERCGSIDFTDIAWEALYETADSKSFENEDADLIYATLEKKLRFISFGEYLKRYIYLKAGITEPFREVPLQIYQQIIRDSFAENHTPKSFEDTSAKLSALSKNWLTQQTVRRPIVFLLGFGLGMSEEDVNDFLTKALRERGIDPKDPLEVICWYCFRNGYGYPKYEQLRQAYEALSADVYMLRSLCGDLTLNVRSSMYAIDSEAALFTYLAGMKTADNHEKAGVTAKACFDELFTEARAKAAALYNEGSVGAGRKKKGTVYTAEDITESDLEHIISAAIPLDRNGNLTPAKASKLNAQFAGKRFSRQHLSDVIGGRAPVTRFDLITLRFFISSQSLTEYPDARARFMNFVDDTNDILERCGMGQLYVTNPYECFVCMCVLSADPLGTYADVWERSYDHLERTWGGVEREGDPEPSGDI